MDYSRELVVGKYGGGFENPSSENSRILAGFAIIRRLSVWPAVRVRATSGKKNLMKDRIHQTALSWLSGKEAVADVQSARYPLLARLSPLLILLLMLGLLAGCGPSSAESGNQDLTGATQRIAQEYQSSGDLAGARASLDNLPAPNPNQLLILTAETTISGGDTANGDALTRLALALGLNSASIERYARSRGLLQQAQPTAPPVAQAQPTPTPQPEKPTPTPEVATATAEAPTATPEPATATPVPAAEVRSQSAMNVRGGPGTNYPVVGALNAGEAARITGKNGGGDWWQIALVSGGNGWVYGPLVTTSGDTSAIAVAEAPAAPPTATAAPAQPTNTPVPAPSGVDFRLVEQHLWDVEENGGFLSGESVNCGEKQELHVITLDAAGNRLDGVTVRGVYRNEFHVTGEKGPGVAQYDINVDGDDIVVAKDTDGREVSSDLAKGLTAKPYAIPHHFLIQGRFCKDGPTCDAFIKANGCYGHFSWTVIFQRTY